MKRMIATIVALAALAAGAFADNMTKSQGTGMDDASSMMAPADTDMMAPSDSMKGSGDAMMSSDMSYETLKKTHRLADTKMGMQLRSAASSGMKVMYSGLMAAEGLAAKDPTVLFFSADWCPYCQADLKDINANGARLGKTNVVVVDYDKSTDLRKKYGVTQQDTYVQIGGMGEKIAIWNGGGVDGILKNIKAGM